MTVSRLASLRPAGAASVALATALVLVSCSTAPSGSLEPSAVSAPPSTPATLAPTPELTPTPTPAPTPRFTNEPDDELAALIPTEANGVPVVVAPFDQFALTPGDIAIAYGELGDRFASLALAYVEQPRTTLYAVRVDGEPVTTEELEPYLATAGRYVGIAGLHPDPWTLDDSAGYRVWVRPEDNATAAGTMIYTWAAEEYVFLLIGVDDAVNRAIVGALPTEPAPVPSPSSAPSSSADASPPASASPSDG